VIALENEIRLIQAFKLLCKFDCDYMKTLGRDLSKLTNSYTVPIICEFIKPYMEIISSLDQSNRSFLSLSFLDSYFDSVSLRKLDLIDVFSSLRINLPFEYRGYHLNRFTSLLMQENSTLISITVEEFIHLELHESDSASFDFETPCIMQFVMHYLELKASKFTKSIVDSENKSMQQAHSIDFGNLSRIVNVFSYNYVYFEGGTLFEKQLGFYLSILRGADKGLKGVGSPSAMFAVADVFNLILLSSDFNKIIDSSEAVDELGITGCDWFQELIGRVGGYIRRFCMNHTFFGHLQSIEKRYAEKVDIAYSPRLYSFLCRAIGESIVRKEMEAISESSNRVDAICRFLGEEAVFQPGLLSAYFIPTSINLHIALAAVKSLSVLLKRARKNVYVSNISAEILHSMEKQIQRFSEKCSGHESECLVEMYSDILTPICSYTAEIVSAICVK
jgi:hypothetical protein